MSRARILALAGATALLSTATFAALSTETLAADLPPPPLPPPVYRPAVVEASGWYLRGFVGMSNQFLSDIHHPSFDTAPQFTFLDKGGFESGIFVGGGIGYAWNNWLRFDVTGEYRGKVGFSALDRYFDLGTWWCVTPFIGAGVGVAQNRIEHFRDTNVIAGGGGWADAGTKSNLAWALYAGASYKVTSNFAIDLSYRYLNLGKAGHRPFRGRHRQTTSSLEIIPWLPPATSAPSGPASA